MMGMWQGAASVEAASASGEMLFWDGSKWTCTTVSELFWDDVGKVFKIGGQVALLGDGSIPLTSDWDIGDTRKILADEIRARNGAGLKLYDDGGNGIFVEDGGNVGIGITGPKAQLDFDGGNVRTQRYVDTATNTNLGDQTFGAGNLIAGGYNSAFGRQGLYSITSGSGNCSFGNESLYNVTTGGNNVGIANFAGKLIAGGGHNINIGYKSGYAIVSGNNNINIGSYSNYVGTGSKNIIIGYGIDLPVDAGDNQLNIGNLIYGTGLDGVDKTVSTGKVGIGTSAPAEKLDVAGSIKLTGNITAVEDFYINAGGRGRFSIQTGGTYLFNPSGGLWFAMKDDGSESKGDIYPVTDDAYKCGKSGARWDEVWAANGTIQTSDERLKDIKELPEGIAKVMARLTPIEYTWKEKDNGKHIGFGAQSIRAIFAEEGLNPDDYWAIQYDKDNDIYSMAYQEFIPAVLAYTQDLESRLIILTQEQQKQIDELRKEFGLWNFQTKSG